MVRRVHVGTIHQLYGMSNGTGSFAYRNNVIALTGNAKQNDKEFLAHYIHHKYHHKHVRLDDPVKEVAKILFDFHDAKIDGLKNMVDVRWSITPQQTMNFIRKEFLDNKIQDMLPYVDKNFLAHLMYFRIMNNPTHNYVISDLQTYNEYKVLSRLHPVVIRVKDLLHTSDEHNILYHHTITTESTESMIRQFDHIF